VGVVPGKPAAGPAHQPDAHAPQRHDQQVAGRQAERDQVGGQAGGHDRHHEHHDDQHSFQHQHQRGGAVGEALARAEPPDVEHHQHHRLDGDPAQDVADGQAEVAAHGGAGDDGDLRQVGGDRQEQQPAQRLAQAKAGGQDVGGVRQPHAGHPHHRRGAGEQDQERRQRPLLEWRRHSRECAAHQHHG
jgi:hypothetical protein